MANIPLGTVTTLRNFISNVRGLTGAINEEKSQLYLPQLVDIIHLSVQSVRATLGKILDPFYWTESAVTSFAGRSDGYLYDISALDIADPTSMTLRSALGKVDLVSVEDYESKLDNYTTAQLTRAMFASILSLSDGSDVKLSIRASSGSGGGPLSLYYIRNPYKIDNEASKLDLPERYVPNAVDAAVVMVFRKVGMKPPLEIDQRLLAFLKGQYAQLPVEITPASN